MKKVQEPTLGNADYWDKVYSTKSLREVSWFSEELGTSKKLIKMLAPSPAAKIIDIGAGRSFLAEELLQNGYLSIAIFDISKEALAQTDSRLKNRALSAEVLVGDVTNYDFAIEKYDLWHDRAVFHFLTEKWQRRAYLASAKTAVREGGHVLIATFGPDGPSKCSGLGVCRYNVEELAAELGSGFKLLGSQLEIHLTPFKSEQQFLYCWFKRT